MRPIVRFALLGILLAPAFAHAEWAGFDTQFDEQQETPWEELQAKLPPYPKDENQQEFYVSGVAGNRYFVDKTSLDVGTDGVVRYVLKINARGGATNVSFEGIRCDTRERKIYAIGQADGTWSRARDDKWRAIAAASSLSYHRPLADAYFCPLGVIVNTPQEALQNIRNGW